MAYEAGVKTTLNKANQGLGNKKWLLDVFWNILSGLVALKGSSTIQIENPY